MRFFIFFYFIFISLTANSIEAKKASDLFILKASMISGTPPADSKCADYDSGPPDYYGWRLKDAITGKDIVIPSGRVLIIESLSWVAIDRSATEKDMACGLLYADNEVILTACGRGSLQGYSGNQSFPSGIRTSSTSLCFRPVIYSSTENMTGGFAYLHGYFAKDK